MKTDMKTDMKADPKIHAPKPKQSRALKHASRARVQRAAVPPVCDDDEPVAQDMDEFRLRLIREIQTMRRMHRRCRAPICRRVKRCADPTMRCDRDFPTPKLTPEQEAATKAALWRVLQRDKQRRGME
jgi:hypothetical protein